MVAAAACDCDIVVLDDILTDQPYFSHKLLVGLPLWMEQAQHRAFKGRVGGDDAADIVEARHQLLEALDVGVVDWAVELAVDLKVVLELVL